MPQPTELPQETTGKTILLVEDSAHDAALTMYALKRCGIANAAIHVVDGNQGLALLRADPTIGLAIIDLKMPGMDGFDFLAQLGADMRLRTLPTILTTCSVLEADRVRALQLGVSRFVVKSLDLKEYVEALCTALTALRGALADADPVQT